MSFPRNPGAVAHCSHKLTFFLLNAISGHWARVVMYVNIFAVQKQSKLWQTTCQEQPPSGAQVDTKEDIQIKIGWFCEISVI